MALETELAFFDSHRTEWTEHHNAKFAVIQGKKLLGFFDEWEDGFKAGIKAFGGRREFLVKQVWIVEPVYVIGAVA
jgi:hypothetical protein